MVTSLKFFQAEAIERLYFWNWDPIQPGDSLFVARWDDLFVIALDEKSFAVYNEEKAKTKVKTKRDSQGKAILAKGAPVIFPVGEHFEWRVECGITCPDGCCGDDSPTFVEKVSGKEAAILLGKAMKEKFSGKYEFVKVRGPGFHTYHRND